MSSGGYIGRILFLEYIVRGQHGNGPVGRILIREESIKALCMAYRSIGVFSDDYSLLSLS